MAALPEALRQMNKLSPTINIAIYADDVALWATAPTSAYSNMQRKLQHGLTVIADEIPRLGLTLSPFNTIRRPDRLSIEYTPSMGQM